MQKILQSSKISLAADKNTLLRFLNIYDGDLVKAQDLLIVNLKLRRGHPHIFRNRNFLSAETQNAIKIT